MIPTISLINNVYGTVQMHLCMNASNAAVTHKGNTVSVNYDIYSYITFFAFLNYHF